jgi:hypothetical protein
VCAAGLYTRQQVWGDGSSPASFSYIFARVLLRNLTLVVFDEAFSLQVLGACCLVL